MAAETAAAEQAAPTLESKTPKLKLKVNTAHLSKAVKAILQLNAKRTADQNPLFDSMVETVSLKFTLSKIPGKKSMRPVMIPLPHPLYNEKSEICFLAKDPPKKYKDLLFGKDPIPGVTKVIGLKKLRTHYKDCHTKRALADAYDLFLCDKSIIEMMPKTLGNVFYVNKKKLPLPVAINDGKNDWKTNMVRAINGSPMRIPTGPCLGMKIGRCNFSEEELVENALAVIKGVLSNCDILIDSICINATGAPALPIWRRESPGLINKRKGKGKNYEDTSSAASDTGASGISETEGTEYGDLPSDAGETISTRETASEVETSEDQSTSEVIAEDSADDVSSADPSQPKASGKKKKGGKRPAEPQEACPPPPSKKKKTQK